MGFLLAAILSSCCQDEALRDLEALRQSIRAARTQARELKKAAHEALDRGEYDAAARDHAKSRTLERQAEDLKKSEAGLIRKALPAILVDLDDENIAVRDRASARLASLGPPAIPFLEGLPKDHTPEVRTRLGEALSKLRAATLDQEGRIRQWAVSAKASSEFSKPMWSAMQATGKPDTFEAGDRSTAWASRLPDAGEEWLELGYENPVRPTHVRIYETYNPGAVRKVEALDPEGAWQLLWTGKDTTAECPGWFTVSFKSPSFAVKTIRVVIDSAAVAGWNEIDAVELIGDPHP